MKISKDEVLHVAFLSRLKLSDDEIENLNMEGVIDFADKLNELDTENIAPTNHILDIKNVFREDKIEKSFERDEILKNAPQKQRGCVVVPQTVEE